MGTKAVNSDFKTSRRLAAAMAAAVIAIAMAWAPSAWADEVAEIEVQAGPAVFGGPAINRNPAAAPAADPAGANMEQPAAEPEEPAAPFDPTEPAEPAAPLEPAVPDGLDEGNAEVPASYDSRTPEEAGVIMTRLYNQYSGEHFYTGDTDERDFLLDVGWMYEGVGWVAPKTGDQVYRLYNSYVGDHHYTLDSDERDYLVSIGWNDEGVGWYSGGAYEVLRQYNPNAQVGTHNFTCSTIENDYLADNGWQAEGVAWKALADTVETFDAMLADYYSTVSMTIAAQDKDLQVNAVFLDSTYYLFLPSFTDTEAVRMAAIRNGTETPIQVASDPDAHSFQTIALDALVDLATLPATIASNGALQMWFKTEDAPLVQKLAIMVSNTVSSVFIDSVNPDQKRAYVEASIDHTAKADVRVAVIDKDGGTVYDNDTDEKASTIKGRGNTTWQIGNKKPYQISLSKKADLLSTGNKNNAQKKWLLLSNYDDVTSLHDVIAYNIGLELDMAGTECAPVDLYYDGEYRGTYVLSEKVEVKKGRVEISDMEDTTEEANPGVDLDSLPTATSTNAYGMTYQYVTDMRDPADITGGYLLEVDEAYYASELCWFNSSWGHVVVKSPEWCSQTAMAYISEYFERAVKRLANGTGAAADSALFDLDSLAKTYLVNELCKNIDSFYSSTFFCKDKGNSPIIAEPLWDFDASMGTRQDDGESAYYLYQGFILPNLKTAMYTTAVQDRVRDIWANQLSPVLHDVLLSTDAGAVGPAGYLHSLSFYRQEIDASIKMNEALHGFTRFSTVIAPFATYDQNFGYLRNWLTWRTAWIDENIWRLSGGRISNAPWTYNGIDYGLVFDASYYTRMNPGVPADDDGALKHFVNSGMAEGLVASRNFDVAAYRRNNPDLVEMYGDDLAQYYLDYIYSGFWEGRVAL